MGEKGEPTKGARGAVSRRRGRWGHGEIVQFVGEHFCGKGICGSQTSEVALYKTDTWIKKPGIKMASTFGAPLRPARCDGMPIFRFGFSLACHAGVPRFVCWFLPLDGIAFHTRRETVHCERFAACAGSMVWGVFAGCACVLMYDMYE